MDGLSFCWKVRAAVLHRNYSNNFDFTPMTSAGRCQFGGCDFESNSLKL